jgi:hypothetical protein
MSMKNHGGMISTEETPDSSTREVWQSYQQSYISKSEVAGEGNDEFGVAEYFHLYFPGDFYML